MKDSQKKQKKTKLSKDNLLISLSILFAILVSLIIANIYIRFWIWQNNTLNSPVKEISLTSYPQLVSKLSPDITAQAAVVIDDSSKTVLYGKNENLRFSMASTTKIMTALVALDYYDLNDVLTVFNDKVEPIVVGFEEGEKVYFIDVLYAMLLPSGNDATLMISQNYPGGEQAFIAKMNEKAKAFNLINTHFEDSIGFSNSNYSTPLEMARLTSIALKNKIFAQIVSTQKRVITNVKGTNTYALINLDQLLTKDGITGVKTGYTDEAGGVLVTSMEEKGERFILVVMKSQDRFADVEKILSLIEGRVTFVSNHP